ncbi:hypothetical protein G4G28_10550 [Massilia sp. Dwa41.01b]|uniref:hypothetical protein n=1 Tax=Massilia sp. Dwa41.01b TaxID=2709302 RepID=UPI0016045434|nr:hypothetical protein [Massilia sp. Dwa41.01b]QNA88820.1 hypothetical protein G4G28_10550 [Massilia sp. Dwa41.01b]
MFTIVLLLYLQQQTEVTLAGSSLRGVYGTRAECEAAAVRSRGPLPTPRGYAAAWHDAQCLPINREVRVDELAAQDIGKLLQGQVPRDCGASGAWRRMSELCEAATGGVRGGGALPRTR